MRNVRFEAGRSHRSKFALRVERHLAERTYEEVASALGMSVARVGQIERSGLARLQACFELIEQGIAIDAAVEQCKGRVGRPRKVAA